jgi:glycine dehydrogenase
MDLRNSFIDRHIGPNDYQTNSMLLELGYKDLKDFIAAVVPKNILLQNSYKYYKFTKDTSINRIS